MTGLIFGVNVAGGLSTSVVSGFSVAVSDTSDFFAVFGSSFSGFTLATISPGPELVAEGAETEGSGFGSSASAG